MGRKSVLVKHPDSKKLLAEFKKLAVKEAYTHAQIAEALNAYLKETGQEEVITDRQVQYHRPLILADMEAVIERKKTRRELIKKYSSAIENDAAIDSLNLSGELLEDMLTLKTVNMDSMDIQDLDIGELDKVSLIYKRLTESKRIMAGLIDKARKEIVEQAMAAMKASGVDEETIRTVERVIVKANDTHR